MAKLNPTKITWEAPTSNTDGSPIVGDLAYRLYVDGSGFADFPGALNPDGKYEADITVMGLPDGASTLTLAAFYVDKPELISDPSNGIDIVLGVARPNPPTGLDAV